MKNLIFTLILCLTMGLQPLMAQNPNVDVESAAKWFYQRANQTTKNKGIGFRNQFINQPDSITSAFWDVDKQTAQIELQAAIKWKTLNSEIVIDQEILYQEGAAFALTYTYNAQNQITGGQVRLLLGPIPIPAGSLMINRDSKGNVTRAGIELSVFGESIVQGDSSQYTYNADNRIASVSRYFYDEENENGAGWYTLDRHENMEYCQDGKLCSMARLFTDEQGIEYVENYSSMEWYEAADERYIQSLQPLQDEYAPRLPFAFFPSDPINTTLLEPIAYVYEVSSSPDFIYRRSNFVHNDGNEEWLCTSVSVEVEGEDPVGTSDFRCYLINQEGRLVGQRNFADQDLQILVNEYTYNYNDYGYMSNLSVSDGMNSYTEEYIFETDSDNRLRKIDLTTAYNPEFGEPSLSGNINEFFYKQGTSVIDNPIVHVFDAFPNPAETSLFVAIQMQKENNIKNIELRIRSLTGEVVFSQSNLLNDQQIIELPVKQLPASLYLIECLDENGLHLATTKFIKK